MGGATCPKDSSMTLKVEIKLDRMAYFLVDDSARRTIPIDSIRVIRPREEPGQGSLSIHEIRKSMHTERGGV